MSDKLEREVMPGFTMVIDQSKLQTEPCYVRILGPCI